MFIVEEGEKVVSPLHHGDPTSGKKSEVQQRDESDAEEVLRTNTILARQQPLEDIIDQMPKGWFHTRLLLVCGAGFTANSMAVSLLSFVSVCASIDWELTDSQNASLIRYCLAMMYCIHHHVHKMHFTGVYNITCCLTSCAVCVITAWCSRESCWGLSCGAPWRTCTAASGCT
jgi:hypothetical protein